MTEQRTRIEVAFSHMTVGDLARLGRIAKRAGRGPVPLDEMEDYISLLERVVVGGVEHLPIERLPPLSTKR